MLKLSKLAKLTKRTKSKTTTAKANTHKAKTTPKTALKTAKTEPTTEPTLEELKQTAEAILKEHKARTPTLYEVELDAWYPSVKNCMLNMLLPNLPISTNKIYTAATITRVNKQYRRIGQAAKVTSNEYRQYKAKVFPLIKRRVRENGWTVEKGDQYDLSIGLHMVNRRRLDVDNCTKSLLDCLTQCNAIFDDHNIRSIYIYKTLTQSIPNSEEFTVVSIQKVRKEEKEEKEEKEKEKEKEEKNNVLVLNND